MCRVLLVCGRPCPAPLPWGLPVSAAHGSPMPCPPGGCSLALPMACPCPCRGLLRAVLLLVPSIGCLVASLPKPTLPPCAVPCAVAGGWSMPLCLLGSVCLGIAMPCSRPRVRSSSLTRRALRLAASTRSDGLVSGAD